MGTLSRLGMEWCGTVKGSLGCFASGGCILGRIDKCSYDGMRKLRIRILAYQAGLFA